MLAGVVGTAVLVVGCSGDDGDRRTDAVAQRPDLRRLVENVHDAGSPGVVAIVRNRSGTWRAAIGDAVVKPRRAMRPVDRLRVASITKTFVATIVLQLVDEERLALDDTVEERFPGLLAHGRRITIRQLLNHTSGLASADDSPETEVYYRRIIAGELGLDVSVREAVALADALPLRFPPGAGQRYANTGYDVLGLIVERVTGTSLGRLLETRIIGPLGLDATSFEPEPLRADAAAHGYAIPGSDFGQAYSEPFDVTAASNFPARWASGSLVSNADDVASFYGALLRGELLPRRLLDEMLRTVATDHGGERAGFGLFRYATACGFAWGHGGAAAGYATQALASKDGKHVVFVGANAFAAGAFHDVLAKTAEQLYCRS